MSFICTTKVSRLSSCLVAVLTVIIGFAVLATHVNAQVSHSNHPVKPDLIMRYGENPVFVNGPKTNQTEVNTPTGLLPVTYLGGFIVHKHSVSIKLVKGEKIVSISDDYKYDGNKQLDRDWTGKGKLPFSYVDGLGYKLKLVYVVVYAYVPGWTPILHQ